VAADDPQPTDDEATPPAADASPEALAGHAESSKGGLGDIIGAVLRGLTPQPRTRRWTTTHRTRTTRSTTHRTTTRRSSGTASGGSGPLLSIHYHDGSSDWVTTRVAFGREGNRIAVISSADAEWWRHIRSASPVQVRVRNKWVDGTARLLAHDDPTYTRAVGVFIDDRSRAAAQRLGIPMDEHGRLDHGARQSGDAAVIWIELEGD